MQRCLKPLGVYVEMIELRRNFVLSQTTFINFINLNEAEKEIVRQLRNHADIKKWMRKDNIIENGEHLNFMEKLKKDGRNFYWLVKSKNLNIGVVYMNNVDLSSKSAYMGIYANPRLRKAGRIVMESLKELSFGLYGLHKLKAEVMESNHRSINFYEKSGLIQKDQVCEGIDRDGKKYNVIFMEMANKQTTRVD